LHFWYRKLAVAAGIVMVTTQPVMARDEVMHMAFQDVLNSPAAKEKLDGTVRFYLAGAKTPKIIKKLRTL